MLIRERTEPISGANFDFDSMWSVNNGSSGSGGNFEGDGLYINWRENQFSLGDSIVFDDGDAFIKNRLEVGSSGVITNSDDDFRTDDDGFAVGDQSSFGSNRAYVIGLGTALGAFWGDSSNIVLEALSTNALVLDSNVQITLDNNT